MTGDRLLSLLQHKPSGHSACDRYKAEPPIREIFIALSVFLATWIGILEPASLLGQTTGAGIPTQNIRHIRRSLLPSLPSEALKQLGDRLERAGKERLTLVGNFQKGPYAQPVAFRFVEESLTRRLRFETGTGSAKEVLLFNGGQFTKSVGTLTSDDQVLVQTLLDDSVEQFFIAQMNGLASRYLGKGYRVEDQSDQKGRSYHMYQVFAPVPFRKTRSLQPKNYYINSRTLLIDRIEYDTASQGGKKQVVVEIRQWGQIQGQRIPVQIARKENGEESLSLSITSAGLGSSADDDTFVRP